MYSVSSAVKLAVVAIAALGLTGSFAAQPACAQFGVGDIVVGLSGAPTNTFRVYDASGDSWSNGPAWQVIDPSPMGMGELVDVGFIQSIEFDNSNGLSHNARGNLLGVNFGNAFTSFELYNLATNGSTNSEIIWNIIEASGGTRGTNPMGSGPLTIRGGGLSVSPGNNYVAWTTFDAGPSTGREIWVHDYSPGGAPGSGAGASLTGPRHTGKGDGNGNAGLLDALNSGGVQSTAWLNDTTVASFNGFGEIITLDVAGIAGGTEDGTTAGFQPTVMTNWRVANSEAALAGAQSADIEYNPAVDPNHIYAAVTKPTTFEGELFVYNYNPTTGAISLANRMVLPDAMDDPPGPLLEPREIALGPDGSLYFSSFTAGTDLNLVSRFPSAALMDIPNWDPTDIEVFYIGGPSTNNGMDVAFSAPVVLGLPGDFNGDGWVDAADYTTWRDHLGDGDESALNGNGDGMNGVDAGDYTLWVDSFGTHNEGGGSLGAGNVPEPASVTLMAMGLIGLATARRRLR